MGDADGKSGRALYGNGIFEKSPYSLIYSYRKIKVWHCFIKKQRSQAMWQGLFVELRALWSLTDRHGLKSEPSTAQLCDLGKVT